MKLFRYKPDVNRYACAEIVENHLIGELPSGVVPIVDRFNEGNILASLWTPVEIIVDGSIGPLSDFLGLPEDIPVFSRKAWEILSSLIANDVEALPLASSEGEYVAINCLKIMDCLDQTRSSLTRRPDGRVQKVISYAFKSDCFQGKHIIKLPESKNLETLVSEEFVKLVHANSLVGSLFLPLTQVAE